MKYIKIYQTRQDFDNDMSNLDYPILALIQDTNETISLLREPEPEPVTYEMTSDWLQWQNVYKGEQYTVHLTITGSDGSDVTLTSINDLTITNDTDLPFDMLLDNNNNLTLVNNSDITRAGERITVTLQYEDAILQLNAYSAVHTYNVYVSKNAQDWTNTITCSFGQYNVDKTEGEPVYITIKDENDNYVEPTASNMQIQSASAYQQYFNWRFSNSSLESDEFKGVVLTYSQDTSFDFNATVAMIPAAANSCTIRCVYESAAKADIESALPVVNDILDYTNETTYDEAQYDNYKQIADDILS